MSGFLLDTNVISELMKPRPNSKLTRWIEATDERLLFLSVLTLGEIRKGIYGLPPGLKRARLEAWLISDLVARFADRILAIDHGVADRWGQFAAKAGKLRLPVIDGMLAATAAHHNLTFVTRNSRDVVATGVSLFDPWAS